jgi:hypothetical protein
VRAVTAALAVVRQIARALAEPSARTLYYEHEVALVQAYAGGLGGLTYPRLTEWGAVAH